MIAVGESQHYGPPRTIIKIILYKKSGQTVKRDESNLHLIFNKFNLFLL